jgi:S1-C subfamily serine protease
MKGLIALTLLLFFEVSPAFAQSAPFLSDFSTEMTLHGATSSLPGAPALNLLSLDEYASDLPVNQLSTFANTAAWEDFGGARSAKDAQLYRSIAPAVVLVTNKDGFGSGSLIDAHGDILTNWHVVSKYEFVGVIFKPPVEGKEPTRDDIKAAHIVSYDQVADLALIKTNEVPTGRNPIRLGDSSEIAVGMDVHAIGHPKGETWTYTTGIISQYRQGYEWQAPTDSIKHHADIIQTQTPLNPGNSGGPLLSDSGGLIGVNSFIGAGEGLGYAVSVDDVKKFLAGSENRKSQEQSTNRRPDCKAKELATFRSKENDATITSLDFFCNGNDTAEYVVPDDNSKAIFLRVDRNGDGHADVIFFDLQRRGKWDLSFWDNKFEGHWALVGYHDDGSLKPTRFESYAEFQKRTASR